jgi:hypothetical protein
MRTCAMRHVAQPCELPHGAFEHTILVTHTSCATPATTRAKAKGGSYVTPSPPTKRSEEPRGAPYHHRYAARHRSTPTCQFWARMNSAAALARFPFDVSRRQMASPIKGYHSGRESSIVDPMRLADWPMAYIGDMVPLAL